MRDREIRSSGLKPEAAEVLEARDVLVLRRAAASGPWLLATELVTRSGQPLLMLVLATFVSPQDFGVMATALIAIGLAQTILDAGLGSALIRTRDDPEEAATVVFWTSLVFGLALYAVLWASAGSVAGFFRSDGSVAVVRVLGLQVVLAAAIAAPQALMLREFAFQRLFRIRLVAAAAPWLCSLPLAAAGAGVWALVAGSLSGVLVNAILTWTTSEWRPRVAYDWRRARRLLGFGSWVMGEALTAWFFTWGDNVIIGRWMGLEALGSYRLAWSTITCVFGLLLGAFSPVLYSTLARLDVWSAAWAKAFHGAVRVMSAIALPTGMAFLVAGPLMGSVLFGTRWPALGLILSVIGFMHGFMGYFAPMAEAYRAVGRPDVNMKLQLGFVLLYVPVYLLTVPLGLEAFTWARAALGCMTMVAHVAVGVRVLRLSPLYFWRDGRPALISAGLMGATMILVAQWLRYDVASLLTLAVVGVATYGAALWVTDRRLVEGAKQLIWPRCVT